MLRFSPALSALYAAALAVSCGSRSNLTDATATAGGTGGAGGAPSSSSSSSASSAASSSGVGAAPGLCGPLSLTGPPIAVEASTYEHGSRPALVPASGDGATVSVVLGRQAVEGPWISPFRITAAAFAPWGDWPQTLGPDSQVAAFGGEAFAAAPALPDDQPGVATMFYVPTDAYPSKMYLAASAAPGKAYDPFPAGTLWPAGEPAWPVALARGEGTHLAAYQIGVGNGEAFMSLGVVAGQGVTVIPEVACAAAPFTAAAIPAPGGYIVAAASGRPFGACPLDNGVPGPATELQISFVDAATQKVTLAGTFQEPDPLAHVALARASVGAWVVWQNNGASAELPAPIRAVRLDDAGAPTGPAIAVTQDGQSSGPFAAAALGWDLVVAWVDTLDPSYPTLQLSRFDQQGHPLPGAALGLGSWLYDPSLSLLAAPDGRAVLLAWSDLLSSEPAAAVVRAARFSCDAAGAP